MKRLLSLLVLLTLCLGLTACGKRAAEPATAGDTTEYSLEALPPQPSAAPLYSNYAEVQITMDNWREYFELCEVPLYMLNPHGGVLEVEQNYCAVIREELAHRLRPNGGYRVDFEIAFDVYASNTLDYDRENNLFLHTGDMLYATRATHSCAFTATALPRSAYGSSYNAYLQNQAETYRNAFFTGSAKYTDGVWAGFYVDLNTAEVVSVQGYLEMGY